MAECSTCGVRGLVVWMARSWMAECGTCGVRGLVVV